MNTQDIRVIKTKKAIKDALFTILKEKPIDKISISEVAEQANINRKTFYTHYDKIEDIFTEMEDELVENIANYLQICMIKEYGLAPYHFMAFVNNLYTANPEFCENLVLVRNYHFLEDKIKLLLKEQIMLSLNVPEERKIITELKIEYFISGISAVYVHWIKSGRPCPFEELNELVVGLTHGAISTLPSINSKNTL